jgi:hypothetical protein
MGKYLLFLFIFTLNLFSYTSNIQSSYAIGIFDEKGNGENIQHKTKTLEDYNGICFSKIVVFGFLSNNKIEVKIGNSIGHLQNSISIYNKQKIKIAEELTFKHYDISKGYFEIRIDEKLYDSKVFVK